ncbi:hypothetical protein CPB86DRAFT_796586 [Serendipita vermifera]|nr:hypothetical protein CPB86DRAFT_796586 [Serendipita vermifera]
MSQYERSRGLEGGRNASMRTRAPMATTKGAYTSSKFPRPHCCGVLASSRRQMKMSWSGKSKLSDMHGPTVQIANDTMREKGRIVDISQIQQDLADAWSVRPTCGGLKWRTSSLGRTIYILGVAVRSANLNKCIWNETSAPMPVPVHGRRVDEPPSVNNSMVFIVVEDGALVCMSGRECTEDVPAKYGVEGEDVILGATTLLGYFELQFRRQQRERERIYTRLKEYGIYQKLEASGHARPSLVEEAVPNIPGKKCAWESGHAKIRPCQAEQQCEDGTVKIWGGQKLL